MFEAFQNNQKIGKHNFEAQLRPFKAFLRHSQVNLTKWKRTTTRTTTTKSFLGPRASSRSKTFTNTFFKNGEIVNYQASLTCVTKF